MKIVKLESIAEIIAGQSPPSDTYNQKGDGLPFFQGKADFGETFPIARYWCKIPTKIALPDDILMSVRAPVGPVNMCNLESCIGRGLSAIRVNKNHSNKYVYYFLKVNEKQIEKLGVGSTFKAITQKEIKAINISIPEKLEDQIRIATMLSKVESLIKQRKEIIALLDEFLKSTFLKMFRDSEKFTQTPIKDVASKVKYSMSSGPFGSNLTSEHYTNEGVVILRGTNVTTGTLDLSKIKFVSEEKAKELERSEIKPNDIVIVAVGSSGKALRIPENLPRAIISQNFNKITPDLSIVNPIYLEYAINSHFVQRQFERFMTDAGRTFLSLTNIKEIIVPIPNLSLQERFAEISNKKNYLKTKFQNSLIELENLFASLAQKAFKGELNLEALEVIVPEEEYQSFTNDRTEPHHFERNIDLEKITVKVKPHKFYGGGEPIVAGESLAILIKERYKDKYFSFEMLANFIKKRKAYDLDKYFSSEEIKANPKYDELEDLKVFLESAILNVEMDVKQKEKRNPWLHLNQHFYNAIKENISLELTNEDFALIKNRTAEERSGIYFKIVPDEIN